MRMWHVNIYVLHRDIYYTMRVHATRSYINIYKYIYRYTYRVARVRVACFELELRIPARSESEVRMRTAGVRMGLIGTPDWNWAVSNAEVPIWIGSPNRGPNWRSIRVQVLIVGLGLLSVVS